jgi:hypothetical protein
VEPRRRQPDDEVARLDVAAVAEIAALRHADAEAGQVVLALLVEAGQLGRLAAEQGAAGLAARLRHPAHHLLGHVDVEPRGGEVVEEEERLGPGHRHVVDRHGDQVDADRVVPAGGERGLELGADAVGAADQDRIAVAARDAAHTGETADSGQDLRSRGGGRERPDTIDQASASVDVDTGVLVRPPHRRQVARRPPGRSRPIPRLRRRPRIARRLQIVADRGALRRGRHHAGRARAALAWT